MAMPVIEDRGLDSGLCDHFGKAPGFILVDADGSDPVFVAGSLRRPSECAPIQALIDGGASVILARGMGVGALERCHRAKLLILEAVGETVADTLDAFRAGGCADFPDHALCDHHGDHGKHSSGGRSS